MIYKHECDRDPWMIEWLFSPKKNFKKIKIISINFQITFGLCGGMKWIFEIFPKYTYKTFQRENFILFYF